MNSSKNHKERTDSSPVFHSREDTKAYYNKISKVYDLLSDHSEAPVRNAGFEKLSPEAGEHILEIGCGTGHVLVQLAQAVGEAGRVYAIDLSEEMLAHSETRLQEAGLLERVEFTCGDAVKMPYPDGSINAVFMSFTLELFESDEIPLVLAECKRVLKHSGRLLIVGMSNEGADTIIRKVYKWTHQHFPNYVDCRPIFVRRAIEDAGFKTQDVSIVQMWVPVEIVLAVHSEN